MKVEKSVCKVQNFIDGNFVCGSGSEKIQDLNPANLDEVIAEYIPSTDDDAQQALNAAQTAFPTWSIVPAPERGNYLFRVAERMEAKKEELAHLITREMGKRLIEAQKEVEYAINILRFYAGEGTRLNGELIASDHPDIQIQLLKEPLGVVLAVTPWNFPLSIPTWKIAPALVAGNTVVLKPSSETPLVAMKLMQLFQEADLPKGVVNAVIGPGRLVSKMIHHPAVQVITFTGSNRVGNLIYQEASQEMKRVQLEMGGKNPLIVLDDADLDLAVDLAIRGGYGQAGQACTATSRVIVQSSIVDEFSRRLVEQVRELKVGNGFDPDVDMGPQVSQAELTSTVEAIQQALEDGATLLYGGEVLKTTSNQNGFFIQPTVLSDVKPGMKIALEEVFGPVIAVMEVDTVEEAIELANEVEYGLSAAVCTKSLKRMNQVVQGLQSGLVKVNMTTTGTSFQAPFGGYKKSSNGIFKELGRDAIEIYTRTKTAYIHYT